MIKRTPLVYLFLVLGLLPAYAREKPIDTEHSTVTVHVGKSGLFSAAGHDHEVTAPIAEGAIDDSALGHIWFRIESAKLTVLPEQDQAEVQTTMQGRVLESKSFPEIRFESTSIATVGDAKWEVSGNLTLHGQTNPVKVQVQRKKGRYEGQATIKQTQFGIQPVSAAGGTIKVKNELQIEFALMARE